MLKRSLTSWAGAVASAAVLLTLCVVPACRAQSSPAAPPAATPEQVESAHLDHLAQQGQFDQVLARLKTSHSAIHDQKVQSLISALNRYDKNQHKRIDERHKSYNEALDKVKSELEAGHVQSALIAAIRAHRLADDPTALLHDAVVRKAIAQGRAKAQAAEKAHQWLEALTYYQALDLLYNDYETYHGDVKRVSHHVQVLQVFAPHELQKLYEAQAKRRKAMMDEEKKAAAKKPGAAPVEDQSKNNIKKEMQLGDIQMLETTPWQVRLQDIDVSMLRQTLRDAARQQVDIHGYKPLLLGAVSGMQVMLSTDGLGVTFPSFKDPQKVQSFRDQLTAIETSLKAKRNKDIDSLDADSIIDQILKINHQTLNLPEQVVVYELAQGAMNVLDPFTAVIWPEELAQFSRSTRGKFSGVGIQITRKDGQLTVESPLFGTPAYQAGIQAGDVIAQVNGEKTDNWTLERAVHKITGPEGTTVTLGIDRKGHDGLIDYKIKRSSIAIKSIAGWQHSTDGQWDYFIDPQERIGYVRLTQFLPQTADDLDAAVEQMQKTGPINGLILDLRFNPGGLLSSAADVVDRFITQGPIVYTVDADRHRTNELRAHKQGTYPKFPLIVLVNGGSASASEITSGALQDYGRALIVGVRSFGKGSVQDLFPLDHGKAFLKLTTQYYMLPLGRIIHRRPGATQWGIQPDLEVKMTNAQIADAMEYRQKVDVLRPKSQDAKATDKNQPEAEDLLKKGLDPQLAAALLVLRTRLVAQDLAVAQARATTATP